MEELTKEQISEIKNSSIEEIFGFDLFSLNENDYKKIDEKIKKIEEYISKLNELGVYSDWQKKDLEFNQNLLTELKKIKDNKDMK